MEQEEGAASNALLPLMRPLIQGDCNYFFANSLDESAQQALSQENFCAVGRSLGQLLRGVISDKSMTSHAVSLGTIRGVTRPLLIGERDVLVQRYFILNEQQQGVVVNAVLRKQQNGSWKILDLVP
jgi:hypothetical protein